jgi:hypothetical protein
MTPPDVPGMAESGLGWVEVTGLVLEFEDESIFAAKEAISGKDN